MDIVERLREVPVNTIHWVKCHDAADEIERLREQVEFERASLRSAFGEMWKLDGDIDRLREALQDICEVYAGSEGIPKPMTAAENYLLERLMEAVRIAARALAGKIEEVSDGHC